MQIEKAVVHRLQRQRETQDARSLEPRPVLSARISGSRPWIVEFAFHLRKTGHGANRHRYFSVSLPVLLTCCAGSSFGSKSANCSSYKRR